MKKVYIYSFVFICVAGIHAPSFSENIALLVPDSLFTIDEDPINFPEDKEFLVETMGLEEPGIQWLVLHLENDLGHTVNIYSSDDDEVGEVEDANDLIFVSEALGSGSVGADYDGTSLPFIATEFYLLDDMGFTGGAASFTGGAYSEGSIIKVINRDHPITNGLPEEFVVTVDDKTTGKPAAVTFGVVTDPSILTNGEVLAVLPSSVNESDAGAELPENVPVLIVADVDAVGNPARIAWLGYSDVNPVEDYGGVDGTRTLALLNENGIKLLDQTIEWLLGKEPTKVLDWQIH